MYTPKCSSLGVSEGSRDKRGASDCYVCVGGAFGGHSRENGNFAISVSVEKYVCGSMEHNPAGGSRTGGSGGGSGSTFGGSRANN